MVETQEQAESRIRLENPEGTVTEKVGDVIMEITGDSYDSWVSQQAKLQIDGQIFLESQVSKKSERDLARQAYVTDLPSHISIISSTSPLPSNAQVRDAVLYNLRATRRIIKVLMDSGIIEEQ